jgi:hypothetical protein
LLLRTGLPLTIHQFIEPYLGCAPADGPNELKNGKITVTDGPFSESKEVIGGWAILQTGSKAEAVRIATEFMEMHRKHWPEFEGESELRPMFDPGMGP